MRIIIAVLVVALSSVCSVFDGAWVKDAWAVKAPTVSERKQHTDEKHQEKEKEWFGRKCHTTTGKFCTWGVSKTNKKKCYEPREGQMACDCKTGDCKVMPTKKWNLPFTD